MKSTIKLFFIAIIFLLFNKISNAQIEDHYHSFFASMSAPLVIDYLKVTKNKQGETKEHIPDKSISISLQISVKDMRIEGNSFSGISIKKSAVYDDIKTFYGEVSEDKKMIKHIVLTRDYILYSIPGEHGYVQEESNILIEIENIPLIYPHYGYKKGVSKITNLEYNKKVCRKHITFEETETESFVKLNDEAAYGPTGFFNFKPGVLKPELVTHITIEGPDTVRLPDAKTDPNKELTIDLIAKSDLEGNFRWETECENIELRPDKNNDDRVNVLVSTNPWSGNHAWVKAIQNVGVIELSAVHLIQINGGAWEGEKTARVMVPSGCKDNLMKGIGALIISDLMKIPGLKVFEGIKIDKLKAEIALSQSGLVSPETWITPDRIIKQVDMDIFVNEVILLPEDRKPPLESITIKIEYKYKGQSMKKTFIWLYGGSKPFFDITSEISSKALEILDM